MSKKYHTDCYGVISDHDGPINLPGESPQAAAARLLTAMAKEVKRLKGIANVLADDLARYNGTTAPKTIRWAEEFVGKREFLEDRR